MDYREMLHDKTLTSTARLVALDMAMRADAGGVVHQNQSELARYFGVTLVTMAKALDALLDLGVLEEVVRPRGTGRGNIFRVSLSGLPGRPSTEARPEATPEPPMAPAANQTPSEDIGDLIAYHSLEPAEATPLVDDFFGEGEDEAQDADALEAIPAPVNADFYAWLDTCGPIED